MVRFAGALLKLLQSALLRLIALCIGSPRTALAVLVFVVGISLFYGQQVRIAIRTEDFNDPSLQSYQKMNDLKKRFRFEDRLTLIFSKPGELSLDDYCRIQTWIENIRNTVPGIAEVSSVFDLRIPRYADGRLHYPRVLEDACSPAASISGLKDAPAIEQFSSGSGRDSWVHIRIHESEKPFRHGVYDYQVVEEIVARAKQDLPDYELHVGGTLYFQAKVLEGIRWSGYLNILAGLLLFGGFYFFYRSLRASMVLLGALLVAHWIVKGGMAWAGHAIDPLSSCIFMMLTVAIIEDYIFVCHLIRVQRVSYVEAARTLALPSFLTSLTTAIGFAALALSPHQNVVRFGLWAACGAMLEWALVFIAVPTIASWHPRFEHWFDFSRARNDRLNFQATFNRPRRVLVVLLTVLPFVLAIFAFQKEPNLGFSPFQMFESDHELNQFRDYVLREKKSEGEVSLLFPLGHPETETILSQFEKDPFVSGVSSRDRVLRGSIAQLPEDIRGLVREDFKRTPLGKLYSNDRQDRAIVWVRSYDTTQIEAFEKRAIGYCRGVCDLVSEVIVSKDYAQGLLRTLYDSFSASLLLVSPVLIWVCIALRAPILASVISSGWSAFFLLSLVLLMSLRIDVVTSVALSVLIGITGDNIIQFLLFKPDRLSESVQDHGIAAFQSVSLMTVITSVLFLSYFRSPKVLAALLIVGLLLMIIGDVWIFSGLLDLKSRKKVK